MLRSTGLRASSRILTGVQPRVFPNAILRSFASTSDSALSPSSTYKSQRYHRALIAPSHNRSASTSTASQTSSRNPNPNASETEAESDPDPDPHTPPPNASAYTRFKLLAKKYGWYAFGIYWILSTIDFSLTYLVVHSVGSDRIEPVISGSLRSYRLWRHGEEETKRLEEEDHIRREKAKAELASSGGKGKRYLGSRMFWTEVALAYTIHKIALLPFRAGLTVAWTPKVVRWLQARGWAGKEGTGRAIAHAKEKIKEVRTKTTTASTRS